MRNTFHFWNRMDPFRYEHLEHKSFVELFALKREAECRLNALRRKEPTGKRRSAGAYTDWIGLNVECIENLVKINREIARRKEKAIAAGVSVFSFDSRAYIM